MYTHTHTHASRSESIGNISSAGASFWVNGDVEDDERSSDLNLKDVFRVIGAYLD